MKERILLEPNIEAFHEYLIEEEKSAATMEKYLRDIRAFLVFAGRRVVTKELVMAYKQNLVEREYAVRSINSMLAVFEAADRAAQQYLENIRRMAEEGTDEV